LTTESNNVYEEAKNLASLLTSKSDPQLYESTINLNNSSEEQTENKITQRSRNKTEKKTEERENVELNRKLKNNSINNVFIFLLLIITILFICLALRRIHLMTNS